MNRLDENEAGASRRIEIASDDPAFVALHRACSISAVIECTKSNQMTRRIMLVPLMLAYCMKEGHAKNSCTISECYDRAREEVRLIVQSWADEQAALVGDLQESGMGGIKYLMIETCRRIIDILRDVPCQPG